jgi:hypothetical protein
MEKITKYKGKWWIVGIILIAIILSILLEILIPTVNADILIFGSAQNYSTAILPNNSYVHQGENISQGNYYNLLGVYGFSGELAHWNNDDSIGRGTPDQIIALKGYGLTFISPEKFKVGRWWQWDDMDFKNGNAYAFYVNPEQQESIQERTIVQTANITIHQNGSTIQIPVTYTQVETYYGTPAPTSAPSGSGTIMLTPTEAPQPTIAVGPINPDVQDQNGNTIPGGVAGAAVVSRKSPVPVVLPIFAVILVLILIWRRK